jgi:hypothetical protein
MSARRRRKPPPEICPVCGEDVPRNALACPECGADDASGWKEDATLYDAVDVPSEEFDYAQFVQEEFGSAAHVVRSPRSWILVAIVLILLLGMMFSLFR